MQKKLPIYLKIKELILREIGSGQWLRGERLPTEAELASQLNVAVGTLRKALAVLEQEGVLERRQGSGTYVAEGNNGQAVYHFFRLEKVDGQAGIPTAKVIALDLLPHQLAAQNMQLPDSSLFWRIRRLRLLDGVTIAVEDVMLPQSRAATLTADNLHESLYLHYREQLGFWIAHVVDAVSVDQMPEWGAVAAGQEAQTACGCVQRQSYDQHGRMAEFSLLWFNPARARYMARWH